jgi:hypothetical protein
MKGYILHIILMLAGVFGLATIINFVWLRDLMWMEFIVGMIICSGKELIWDMWWKQGTPEWKDMYFDVWGGLGGLTVAYMIW